MKLKRIFMAGSLLGLLAGLALLGSTALAVTPAARSIVPHAGATVNISFDGFCDGLAISLSGVDDVGLNALPTGCNAGLWTEFGFMSNGGTTMPGALIATQGSGIPFFYLIKMDHTWAGYYDLGGGVAFEYNSGTWSFGAPAAPAKKGSRSSAPNASLASFATHPQPLFTANIHFNGYCDGMSLNLPGAAGTPSLDGVQTGCASDGLIGAYSGVVAGSWDSLGPNSLNSMWMLTPDGSFTIYGQNEDGTEYIINTGTWGLGAPPLAAPQLKLFPSAGLGTR